jgi:hypothetical protein
MRFEYDIMRDGDARITSVIAPESEVVIPDEIDGYMVSCIGTDFIPEDKSSVSSIILPDTIRSLEPEAVIDLHYLKKLKLNSGLKEIGERGIYTCPDLLELFVPSTVETFGEYSVGYMYEHGRSYRLRYFMMLCSKDSPAEKYAEDNFIRCRCI